MTDILGADPDELDAYARDVRSAVGLAQPGTWSFLLAWSALEVAPASPPIAPPASGGARLQEAIASLRTASVTVEGYAEALRALDTDFDGRLDGDELPSAEYLELFLRARQLHRPHDVFGPNTTLPPDPNTPFPELLTPYRDETDYERLKHLRRDTERLYALSQDLVEVVDDGSSGDPRQIRINLNDPGILEGTTREELQAVLELHGIAGEDPLHFLVHGFTTDTGSLIKSGDSVADLYSDRGDDTTVVTIDWDSADNALNPLDWPQATGNADEVAPALRDIFDAINDANPDADVKISAHSLGNKVALNALTDMTTEGGMEVDYLAIQPAIPRYGYEKDEEDFGALVSDRIKTLTVTVNDGDNALAVYNDYGTNHALGEAEPGDDAIVNLLSLRDELGLSTTIRDHKSQVGDSNQGHLGLDPDLEVGSDDDTDGDPLLDSYLDQIGR